jgi:hypothetical protein
LKIYIINSKDVYGLIYKYCDVFQQAESLSKSTTLIEKTGRWHPECEIKGHAVILVILSALISEHGFSRTLSPVLMPRFGMENKGMGG